MARALSPDLCSRLTRLLPMLSSDQPGEVAAAAAAITRVLKAAERDWHDLTAWLAKSPPASAGPPPKPKPEPRPAPKPEYKPVRGIDGDYVLELVEGILASDCYLSDKAKGFLESLEERSGRYDVVTFSEKQWEWLVGLLKQAGMELETEE